MRRSSALTCSAITRSAITRSVPLLALSAALLLAGCAGHHSPRPPELQLEHADFIEVAHALEEIQPAVAEEVAATKLAWPSVVNGLHTPPAASARLAIEHASARAGAVGTPGVFQEHAIASLTGPGSPIADAFRSFSLLSARGWQMIASALEQVERGPQRVARFAHANAGLYIESVYDGHFTLAQIGKKLLSGYHDLGGAGAFGSSLSPEEIQALSSFYSEENLRLHPHTGVKFGS